MVVVHLNLLQNKRIDDINYVKTAIAECQILKVDQIVDASNKKYIVSF